MRKLLLPKISRRESAFSLVEILVVLAIIAVVLSLGITALINMRNTALVKQSLTDFQENITSLRNNARNTVLAGRTIPFSSGSEQNFIQTVNDTDYLVLSIKNKNYQKGTCAANSAQQLDCKYNSGNLLKENGANVIVTASDDCAAIIFFLSTGKFKFGRVSGDTVTFSSTKNCTYSFKNEAFAAAQLDYKGSIANNKFESL